MNKSTIFVFYPGTWFRFFFQSLFLSSFHCRVYHNTMLSGYVFDVMQGIGPRMCISDCRAKRHCLSINYRLDTLECEFSSESHNTVRNGLSRMDGYHYIEIERNTPGQCITGRTRVNLSSGGTVCLISECMSQPPTVPYSSVVISGQSVGDVATYTCNDVQLSNTSTCGADGKWSSFELNCNVSECLASSDCLVHYAFPYDKAWRPCSGTQYMKTTVFNGGLYVGVIVCWGDPHRFKLFLSNSTSRTFYNVADSYAKGGDHCQLIDGPSADFTAKDYLQSPETIGYFRNHRNQNFSFGPIGHNATSRSYNSWIHCPGVEIPGTKRVVYM